MRFGVRGGGWLASPGKPPGPKYTKKGGFAQTAVFGGEHSVYPILKWHRREVGCWRLASTIISFSFFPFLPPCLGATVRGPLSVELPAKKVRN